MKRFINFLKFLIRSWSANQLGYELVVDIEEAEARRDNCFPCRNNKDGFCDLCGCDIEAKTLIAQEACPRKFWNPIWRKRK